MRLNVQVGDVIGNGFVVVSTARPVCKSKVRRMPVNLRKHKSCGCQQVANSRMTRTITKWSPLVSEANKAFGTDPSYAVEFARLAPSPSTFSSRSNGFARRRSSGGRDDVPSGIRGQVWTHPERL